MVLEGKIEVFIWQSEFTTLLLQGAQGSVFCLLKDSLKSLQSDVQQHDAAVLLDALMLSLSYQVTPDHSQACHYELFTLMI